MNFFKPHFWVPFQHFREVFLDASYHGTNIMNSADFETPSHLLNYELQIRNQIRGALDFELT